MLQFNRNDSVTPFERTLKAGIIAMILPTTALPAPKKDAESGLRAAKK